MRVLKKGLARDLWGFQDWRSHILKEEFTENTSRISDMYILNPYMQSPLSLSKIAISPWELEKKIKVFPANLQAISYELGDYTWMTL